MTQTVKTLPTGHKAEVEQANASAAPSTDGAPPAVAGAMSVTTGATTHSRLVFIIRTILLPLSSMKLTVALFAMAMFIVLAGTVAQIDKGVWTVVRDYFRTPIAWIDLYIFFPRAWNVPGRFLFPGGWLIGAALLVNLICAHAVRFKVKARGARLIIGLAVLAVGALLTWMVVVSVFDHNGLGETLTPYWRVTMQMLRGGVASVVLFAGCTLVFYKRAGIVLLHSGIILMMISELTTGLYAEEGNIRLHEGQGKCFAEDIRAAELAIVDPSDPQVDHVVVVPDGWMRNGRFIHDERLPFDIMVRQYMKNSVLADPSPDGNLATAGAGLRTGVQKLNEVSGVDPEQNVDIPAAYMTFKHKGSSEPLGTYLVSIALRPQTIQINTPHGAKTYEVALRFKRRYLRSEGSENYFWLHLVDFRHDKYVGTNTPKNFSSDVRLVDADRNVDREVKIWMNNPLRYAGEVFYQASFDDTDDRVTILQAVRNQGWMVPYVSCMIVATGLLAHFGTHLTDFLRRRLRS